MGAHWDWNTRTVPALLPGAVALLPAVDVPAVAPAADGETLLAPETPAELGDAAAEVRGVEVVDAAPLVPNVTEPTASCTLSGGAGITPVRT